MVPLQNSLGLLIDIVQELNFTTNITLGLRGTLQKLVSLIQIDDANEVI